MLEKKNIPASICDSLYNLYTLLSDLQKHELDSLYHSGKMSIEFYTTFHSLLASEYINQGLQVYSIIKKTRYLEKIKRDSASMNTYYENDGTGQYKKSIMQFVDQVKGKGEYKKISGNEIGINYAILYDSLDHFFKPPLLNFVRFKCLNNIKLNDTKYTYQKLLDKFLLQTANTGFDVYFQKKFLAIPIVENADLLSDEMGNTHNLQQLIASKKGKKIYLDFWASWCAPCLNAISNSRSIRDNIDTARIEYIFISLDKDRQHWINSVRTQNISRLSSNYIFLEAGKSKFQRS